MRPLSTFKRVTKHVSKKLWPDPPKKKGILSSDVKPIIHAAHTGNLDDLEMYLRRYEIAQVLGVTCAVQTGRTLMHYAAKKGDLALLEKLLDHGANINIGDNLWATPLHVAAAEGQKEAVAYLVKRGATIDMADDTGWQPISAAAQNGHHDTVELLLDLGARADAASADLRNPLHAAVRHPATLKLLLDRGANPDAADVGGGTALMWICRDKEDATLQHSASILLRHGARLDLEDKLGRTARQHAEEHGLSGLVTLIDAEESEREENRLRLTRDVKVRHLWYKHRERRT
jgi:hypothetical protein